jgi:helicase SWR1
LDDEEEVVTDTEEDVVSDDDASIASDDSNADKEEEESDGAEDMPVSAPGVDSEDEDDEEDVSAAALLGLNLTAVLPDDTLLVDANGDIEMIEEETGTPAIEEASTAVFDDDPSPHSDLVATPSSDPLPGSPPSIAPAPHPIVLSPPHDSSPHTPPLATTPFNGVLISVEEGFHPVCKAPTAVSRVADMPTDSLAPQNDPHVHEMEKPLSNGDFTMGESQELVSTPPPMSVTHDNDAERPDLPANGTSQSVPGTDNTAPLPEEDDAASAIGDEFEEDARIPRYLKPYAVAPLEWDPNAMIRPPALLRGILRPYQQAGLEWLASIHARNLNCILADEMGLGCVFLSFFLSHQTNPLTCLPVKPSKLSPSWHIWRATGASGVRI